MGTTESVEGGCLCGTVRYKIAVLPERVAHCHCSMCRRASGAAMVTWATVPNDSLRIVKGEPRWFQSSDHGRRAFCANCGSPMFFTSTRDKDWIDVTLGSMDRPERLQPKRHVYEPDRIPWMHMADGLPRHGGDSSSPQL